MTLKRRRSWGLQAKGFTLFYQPAHKLSAMSNPYLQGKNSRTAKGEQDQTPHSSSRRHVKNNLWKTVLAWFLQNRTDCVLFAQRLTQRHRGMLLGRGGGGRLFSLLCTGTSSNCAAPNWTPTKVLVWGELVAGGFPRRISRGQEAQAVLWSVSPQGPSPNARWAGLPAAQGALERLWVAQTKILKLKASLPASRKSSSR